MGHSWRGTDSAEMKIAAVALVCLIETAAQARAADAMRLAAPDIAVPHVEAMRRAAEPPRPPRTCFTSAETREKVVSHRLSEPFRLLRGAAGHVQGEALRAKLCRLNEDYVYEIALLRRDGHIVHVTLNAVNGQVLNEH